MALVSPEGATPKQFLPYLKVMDCRSYNEFVTPFPWDHAPQHYCQGHRWSVMLKSAALKVHIADEISLQLLQLVDKRVDL